MSESHKPPSQPEQETYRELQELIDGFERIEWTETPGVSSAEAAAIHARLRESHQLLADDLKASSPR